VAAALVARAQAQPLYLPAEARIEGKELHAFEDEGRMVTVVLGPFALEVDDRRITGRDAAVWVRERVLGRTRLRELLVYAEGDVKITEPDGATVSDSRMLVIVRHKGRLAAEGTWVATPLRDYPFYIRAREARRKYLAGQDQEPGEAISVVSRPEAPTERPPAADGEPATPPRPAGPPEPLEPLEIVSVRLGSVQTMVVDEGTRRVTIARADKRGPVYLALGAQKSTEYIEMRARSLVVFSEKRPARDVRVPYAADTFGAASGLKGGEEDWQEGITGIYLEGDVRIERGERRMTGPRAYYDMSTDRATIPNGVFRTIQEQRNIPIWIMARQVRSLSAREWWFKDAKISTSDFHTPTYHVGASEAYVKDTTPYDVEGEALAPESFAAEMKHVTFNVRGLPMLYWPWSESELQRDHTALRKLTLSDDSVNGFGVQTQWHLFRLLGFVRPEGYRGRLDLDWTQRGPRAGAKIWYTRRKYWGFADASGIFDQEAEDDFGDKLENIDAPDNRGRVLIRHRQMLEKDWQVQFELSYLCDKNYLRQFEPLEFWSGKEQETLVYAKKAQEDWAFTAMVKQRLNRFQEQEEALPELTFWILGKPLGDGLATYYSENRGSVTRYRYPNDDTRDDSDYFLRGDTRHELTFPLQAGVFDVTPFAVGRLSAWEDDPPGGGKNTRWFGQLGLRAGTHLWKTMPEVRSKLWNIDGLRHIVQPEVTAFLGSTGDVHPKHLFPIDDDVEQNLERLSGVTVGLHQRLQTRRGVGKDRRTTDWMRMNLVAGFYDNNADPVPSNGKFLWYRPENSVGRNHINGDWTWHLSDSTTVLADVNYDLDRDVIGQANAGLAVNRGPRLRYYLGWGYIKDMDTSLAKFVVNYKINKKYSVTFTEYYDMDFSGRENMVTQFAIYRKLPRWNLGFHLGWDARYDDLIISVSAWPEGVPEFRIRGSRLSLLGTSDRN
jgi:hypothetical protein